MTGDIDQSSDVAGDVVVACAADDAFAMPMATTIASAVENLGPGRKLTVWLLDGGISAEHRRQIETRWESQGLTSHWIHPQAERLAGLPVSDHINLLTYFRLLLPAVLPEGVAKVIYLDSDLLVLRDLGELWDRPLEDRLCLAAPDVACPSIDASQNVPNYRRCAEYMAAVRPVPNFARLGIPRTAKYFNGGVMVIDLRRWREADLASRFLRCLHDNRYHVKYWDQYALNVVLAGCWGELDMRWNQGAHIYRYPSWQESPFQQAQYEQIRSDPYIVHFSSTVKPWHAGSTHPYRERFLQYVDQTAWSGWRPQPSARDWRRDLANLIQQSILFAGRKYRFVRAHLGM